MQAVFFILWHCRRVKYAAQHGTPTQLAAEFIAAAQRLVGPFLAARNCRVVVVTEGTARNPEKAAKKTRSDGNGQCPWLCGEGEAQGAGGWWGTLIVNRREHCDCRGTRRAPQMLGEVRPWRPRRLGVP